MYTWHLINLRHLFSIERVVVSVDGSVSNLFYYISCNLLITLTVVNIHVNENNYQKNDPVSILLGLITLHNQIENSRI